MVHAGRLPGSRRVVRTLAHAPIRACHTEPVAQGGRRGQQRRQTGWSPARRLIRGRDRYGHRSYGRRRAVAAQSHRGAGRKPGLRRGPSAGPRHRALRGRAYGRAPALLRTSRRSHRAPARRRLGQRRHVPAARRDVLDVALCAGGPRRSARNAAPVDRAEHGAAGLLRHHARRIDRRPALHRTRRRPFRARGDCQSDHGPAPVSAWRCGGAARRCDLRLQRDAGNRGRGRRHQAVRFGRSGHGGGLCAGRPNACELHDPGGAHTPRPRRLCCMPWRARSEASTRGSPSRASRP